MERKHAKGIGRCGCWYFSARCAGRLPPLRSRRRTIVVEDRRRGAGPQQAAAGGGVDRLLRAHQGGRVHLQRYGRGQPQRGGAPVRPRRTPGMDQRATGRSGRTGSSSSPWTRWAGMWARTWARTARSPSNSARTSRTPPRSCSAMPSGPTAPSPGIRRGAELINQPWYRSTAFLVTAWSAGAAAVLGAAAWLIVRWRTRVGQPQGTGPRRRQLRQRQHGPAGHRAQCRAPSRSLPGTAAPCWRSTARS